MKTRKTAILLCLILCFTALFPIASAAGEDAATQSVVLKDGIRAKLSATSENEKVVANITIENKGCEYLGNIKCKLLLPDGIVASATDFSINYVIAVGDKWDFNAVIEKSELKAPDIDTEQKSDGIYIVMAVSIACLIVAVIVFVCIRKKKNNIAMLLIGSILLPYFAFSTNGTADAATRYITLSENVTIGDETYRIEAEIEYEYNFKEENAEEWKKRNLTIDGIYTGFLGSELQVEKILNFINAFRRPETLLLVDPVMGDGGQTYDIYTETFGKQMRKLVERADVITPNLTELCILTDTDYTALTAQKASPDYLNIIAKTGKCLLDMGIGTVIVTGIIYQSPSDATEKYYNLVMEKEQVTSISSDIHGGSYSGTGDLLASVVCAGMVRGDTATDSVRRAVSFLETALIETAREQIPRNDGINFEPYLKLLL